MKYIFKMSLLFIVATVVINYLIPLILNQRPVIYCTEALNAQGPESCQTTSLWYGNLQSSVQKFGFFLSVAIFGILIARSKQDLIKRQHIHGVIIILGYVCIIAAIELLFFRPLVMMTSSSGVIYPPHELNMVYATTITLWPFIIGITSYCLTLVAKKSFFNRS